VISTNITPELVTHSAVGETTLTQVTEAMRGWYSHPEFDPGTPILWDVREATMGLPDDDLEAWSDSNRPVINELRSGRKTAWVFSDPEAAEFTSNLLAAHDWQHKVRIFNDDIEAAKAWLASTIK